MRVAWVLNLDADNELRNPVGYMVSQAVQQRMAALAQHVLALASPGDVIISTPPKRLVGEFLGQAWCPTPRALSLLHEVGARRPRTPPLEILQRVNHRGFCAELGQTLEGGQFVKDLDELRRHVAAHPWRTWLLKRPYGFSGLGHRQVSFPGINAASLDWIEASFRSEDGLQAEPLVTRELDCVIHGYVDEGTKVRLGEPTVQVCDERGSWVRTELATRHRLLASEREALVETASHTAEALAGAGYFGPFGIDAFRWRAENGSVHFNPRSDLNARYTMGWHIGMGDWRPHLEPADRRT